MTRTDLQTFKLVWNEYEKGVERNLQSGFYGTVRTNENFFIGRQWEGVEANGLPTPVFNFLKRAVLFTVASITSGNIKMRASEMPGPGDGKPGHVADIVNAEFEKLFEANRMLPLVREFMRNAAVDGDGCTYTYWDPDVETGQAARGGIVTEVIENTRVYFGNPSDRRVQRQPYIIISSREMVDAVRERARENGAEGWDEIRGDEDARTVQGGEPDGDEMATVLLKLWRSRRTGTVWAYECTRSSEVARPRDTGLKLYPVTWLCWDYVQDSYHGQAMVTGLIPNQIFINKLYAMSMISLMTTAYPKVVYDKTRIFKWDNRVGAAIPVQGGDMNSVAKIIDPAQISPQIAQFIQMAVRDTLSNLGVTNVSIGEVRPENTSAIIALQKASAVPHEIIRQNFYQSLEDLGRIYIDFMGEYYGTRDVGLAGGQLFDFGALKRTSLALKLDVGASSYWSEVASMQTLDNLLRLGKIDVVDYLERIPDDYILKRRELLEKLRAPRGEAGALGGAAEKSGGENKTAIGGMTGIL